ncbi:MAG: PhzF family phenazine biosynthesis protein [Candidatus Competibacteraceae bacterium]
MRYAFHTLDVFTRQIFGGNPLAVLPDARGLNETQMRAIAREFNLSETVFVLPPDHPTHARHLRIFTPAAELPFAGHPTLGAAWLLAALGAIPVREPATALVFEEGVGPVAVEIAIDRSQPTFARLTAAQLPLQGPEPPEAARLADMLALTVEDLADGEWRPEAWSCGVPFLYVPLRDRTALARARLRLDCWEATLAAFWAPQVYPFCRDPSDPALFHARMFAPALGVAEDPATGAAAAAFTGYLARRTGDVTGARQWRLVQGMDMGRPSALTVDADLVAGQPHTVRVGGAAVQVSTGELEVP